MARHKKKTLSDNVATTTTDVLELIEKLRKLNSNQTKKDFLKDRKKELLAEVGKVPEIIDRKAGKLLTYQEMLDEGFEASQDASIFPESVIKKFIPVKPTDRIGVFDGGIKRRSERMTIFQLASSYLYNTDIYEELVFIEFYIRLISQKCTEKETSKVRLRLLADLTQESAMDSVIFAGEVIGYLTKKHCCIFQVDGGGIEKPKLYSFGRHSKDMTNVLYISLVNDQFALLCDADPLNQDEPNPTHHIEVDEYGEHVVKDTFQELENDDSDAEPQKPEPVRVGEPFVQNMPCMGKSFRRAPHFKVELVDIQDFEKLRDKYAVWMRYYGAIELRLDKAALAQVLPKLHEDFLEKQIESYTQNIIKIAGSNIYQVRHGPKQKKKYNVFMNAGQNNLNKVCDEGVTCENLMATMGKNLLYCVDGGSKIYTKKVEKIPLNPPPESCIGQVLRNEIIPGINTFWDFICGGDSFFPIHIEDSCLLASNLMLDGPGFKLWFVLPAFKLRELQRWLDEQLPDKKCHNKLLHKDLFPDPTMMPEHLQKYVTIIPARAGSLVLLDPGCAHWGMNVNSGYAIACNFICKDWVASSHRNTRCHPDCDIARLSVLTVDHVRSIIKLYFPDSIKGEIHEQRRHETTGRIYELMRQFDQRDIEMEEAERERLETERLEKQRLETDLGTAESGPLDTHKRKAGGPCKKSAPPKKQYVCDKCGHMCNTRGAFWSHNHTHVAKAPCDVCGKIVSKSYEQRGHKKKCKPRTDLRPETFE